MGDKTGISWTDATWNPIAGCSIVSPGCTNCYAMAMAARLPRMIRGSRSYYEGLTQPSNAGPVWAGKVVQAPNRILTAPLRWKRPRRIFVNSMSDLFHESVPDEWIDRVFAVMALLPQHTFQALTKRPKRMRTYFEERWQGTPAQRIELGEDSIDIPAGGETGRQLQVEMACEEFVQAFGLADTNKDSLWTADGSCKAMQWQWPLPNVWLGVTAEDQPRADERIPDLLATPAAKRFVSIEPMLGPVDLADLVRGSLDERGGEHHIDALSCDTDPEDDAEFGNATLDWVICGGESGPNARPIHPQWARSLRDQCTAAGVPFFFKQWGEWAPGSAFGMISDGPITCKGGRVKDWMNRYVLCEDRGDRLRGHSFANHTTELVYRVGKRRAGSLLDGVEHKAFPA